MQNKYSTKWLKSYNLNHEYLYYYYFTLYKLRLQIIHKYNDSQWKRVQTFKISDKLNLKIIF